MIYIYLKAFYVIKSKSIINRCYKRALISWVAKHTNWSWRFCIIKAVNELRRNNTGVILTTPPKDLLQLVSACFLINAQISGGYEARGAQTTPRIPL